MITREDRKTMARISSFSAMPLKRSMLAALVVATLCLPPTAALAAGQNYLKIPSNALGVTKSIEIDVNKSMIVDLPTNAGEVIASQPNVANVVMRTKTRAIVQGIAGGDSNIFFLDAAGNNIAVLDIKVTQPRSDVGNALESAIARNIPGSAIRVESVLLDGSTNRVVLSGTALSDDDVSKAVAIAIQFAGDARNVASIINISGNQQVKLKVTVAEVNRDVVKQLGINLDGTMSIGTVDLKFGSHPTMGNVSGVANGNSVGVGFSAGPLTIDASLQALERRGALRTLAEPTLTAMSGESAEFNVGGQFPFLTRDSGGNSVTDWKDYGVKLNFTPTVKSNGFVSLLVDTGVSELASGGGITERRAKTTVELPVGSTLAIGGMLKDTVRQEINKVPGLGDVPILGALFRSRDFVRNQTELVILVTPYMAQPNVGIDKPTDNYHLAGDAESIFLGHMEKMYGVGNDGMRGSYSGSVGFVLD
jgi:pilus assembly protein CpaC